MVVVVTSTNDGKDVNGGSSEKCKGEEGEKK